MGTCESKPPIWREYSIKRGDDVFLALLHFEAEGGLAFWDGYVAKAQLRSGHFDGALIHEFDLDPVLSVNGTKGVLTLYIRAPKAETIDFPVGYAVGDVEIESDNLPKTTVMGFSAPVRGHVTKP